MSEYSSCIMKSLVQRTFQNLYPVTVDSKHFAINSVIIQSKVIHFTESDFLYWIDSPSSKEGERTYPLRVLEDYLVQDTKTLAEPYLRGTIGETICRIHTEEFLRRKKDHLKLSHFEFLKRNNHSPSIKNTEFQGRHRNRYAIEIYRNDNLQKPITEYDGVVTYTTQDDQHGVIICEAKTGDIDYFGSIQHSQKAQKELYEKIIQPSVSLFGKQTIDLLLMATPKQIYANKAKHQIHSRFKYLFDALQKHNIGLILRPFNESRGEFTDMVQRVQIQKKVLAQLGNNYLINKDKTWQIIDNYVYLFKGRRLEALYKKTQRGLEQIRVRESF